MDHRPSVTGGCAGLPACRSPYPASNHADERSFLHALVGVGDACWTVLVGGRDALANSRRSAFAVRDGGVLLVPAELSQLTQRRMREQVVATLLRAARGREGMASAVER